MVDILIIADLYSVSISLWNSFLHDLSRISSILIVSNHLEAINIIDTKNIDIIVLDLNTLDENNYSIIDYILSNNIEKFYKCFLVFNNCNFSLDNFSSYIYNYSHTNIFLDNVSVVLNNLIDTFYSKEIIIKNKITSILDSLNYNRAHIGTKYISECIFQAYTSCNIYNINLSKDLYPLIAKKYNKTINNIKCNITHATNYMYIYHDYSKLTFPFIKPTTKEIIMYVLDLLNN